MATGNGGLHFEPTMDIGQIKQAANTMKKEITDTTKAVEAMGTAFDLMTDITKQDIKDQKQYISGLEKEYAKLESRIKSMPKGSARDSLQKEATTIRHEIESEKEALDAMEIAVERNSKAHLSFRTQLRQVNQEMMELAANGQRDTDAYRELQEKAVELQKSMGLVSKQTAALSSPTAGFQGVASGIAGVTGAFAAANGIIGLFGGSSENLNKIMARTQSLMAITMGLQQVANTLYEGSAFRVSFLAKVKSLFAKSTKEATAAEVEEAAALSAKAAAEGVAATATTAAATAQTAETAAAITGTAATKGLAGAFKMLGAAIKKVPVFGWIIAGVTALVALLRQFASNAREAAQAAEEIRKKTAELAVKPVADIELLSMKFKKLGDNIQEKQKFVDQYADKFKELGVNVKDVAAAEKLLIDDKDAFVNAQIAKARALAARELAQNVLKEKIELQLELETTPETQSIFQATEAGVFMDTPNPYYKSLEKKIQEKDRQIRRMFDIAEEAEEEGADALTRAGINAWREYEAGTVGAIEQAIAAKQNALKNVTNKADYDKIVGEIADLQKQLEKITGGSGNATNNQTKKGAFDIIEVVEKLDQKLADLRVLKEKVRKTGIVDQDELDGLEEQIKKLEDLVAKFKELRDPGLVPKLEPIKPKELVVKPNEVKIEPKEVEVMPQSISRWRFVWQDIKHYFEELDYAEVADNFGEIAHKIREIGDAAGNADLRDFAEGLEELSSLAGTVIQGFAQGGWVGALVNAIGWVASSLLEMAAQDAAVGKAIEDSYLATALKKINDMMQSVSEYDKWGAFFGSDSLGDFNSTLSALTEINDNIRLLNMSDNLRDYANLKKYPQINASNIDPSERMMTFNDVGTFWNWFGIEDDVASLTELVEMMGYKADDLYDKYGNLDAEVLQQILNTYTELNDEDREWIEAAIEFSNQYADAMQQVADYMRSLFGEVADTIADQMIDAFLESGQAAVDFGDVVSDVAKRMAKDLIKNLMYERIFKELEESIMYTINTEYGGDLNADSAAAVLLLVQEALGKIDEEIPYYQQILESLAPFFDGSVAEEAAMSGNLLQSASQDSVSLLNGQLNAMRAYQGRMEGMMTQVLMSLAGIRDDMNDGFNRSVQHLQNIDSNTSEHGSILHAFGLG